jgi:hypothetical protein
LGRRDRCERNRGDADHESVRGGKGATTQQERYWGRY